MNWFTLILRRLCRLGSDRRDAEDVKDVGAQALENGAAVLPSEAEHSCGSKTEFLPYKASNSLSSRSSMRS
jgi:hypothetical protein